MRLNELFTNRKKAVNEEQKYESRWAKFSDEQLQKRLSELETAYAATKAKTQELYYQIEELESEASGLDEIAKIAGVSEYDVRNITDKLREVNAAIFYIEEEVASAIKDVEYEIEERSYPEESIGEATRANTVPATTPRNFVAKNAKTSGSGQHKDPRKAEQQVRGQKHKKPVGVEEDAPPTAKAERMVKHIKAGYAKDGKLTAVEKSKAYGAAWKAHNKK
jgi:hypothetical protein